MRRFVPPAWFLSALLAIVLVGAFAYADKTRLHWYAEEASVATAPTVVTVERDRVVGVLVKCGTQTFGSVCYSATYSTLARLVVTVRSTNGSTYTVELPLSTDVSVGDPWP